jgi:site-specific recombinase XerD
MTPDEALMEFRAWLRLRNYRPSSITDYTAMLKPFWAWLSRESITDLRSITRAILERYAAHVQSQSVSRFTQALRIRAIKRLFSCLVANNHLLIDPADGLRDPSSGQRLPRPVLTQAEIKRLLSQPNTSLNHGIRDRALLELLYSTGLRIGEAVGLTVHDVDLSAGLISVRSGKVGKSRVVPLGREATKWLREYLEKIRPRQNRLQPHERSLFLTQMGTALQHHMIRMIIGQSVISAKIKKQVTCHTIRHTCATHLLEAGANLIAIKELLGHRNIETTQIYTRVRPVDVKAMHQKTHPREVAPATAVGTPTAVIQLPLVAVKR